MFARNKLGQVARFLFGIAPAADLVDAEVGVCAIAQPYGRGRAGNFLLRDDMLQIAQAQAAIGLFHRNAVQAQFAHFRPQRTREPVLRIDPGGQRGDAVIGEAAAAVADHVRSLTQGEIEIGHWRLSITSILAPARPREKLKGRCLVYSFCL